jgi:tRNA (cytidine/uridine-2'-O-)-methyltransferase
LTRQPFQPDDVFVFGRETSGLPPEVMAEFPQEHRLRLPMLAGQRSLNLSNAVAVMVFEAWRQQGFAERRLRRRQRYDALTASRASDRG